MAKRRTLPAHKHRALTQRYAQRALVILCKDKNLLKKSEEESVRGAKRESSDCNFCHYVNDLTLHSTNWQQNKLQCKKFKQLSLVNAFKHAANQVSFLLEMYWSSLVEFERNGLPHLSWPQLYIGGIFNNNAIQFLSLTNNGRKYY